jgi:FkbM family methyltransferase
VDLVRRLNKPHYFHRPRQVLERLRCARYGRGVARDVVVELPWGLDLAVRTTDAVGHTLERTGIFDAAVSETLFRLTDRDDTTVDVGANVGYMTSIMATRVGDRGTVICFEPQPDLRDTLEANVCRWRARGLRTAIEVRGEALSDVPGVGHIARALPGESRDGEILTIRSDFAEEEMFVVAVSRLDDVFGPRTSIGMLKIDVEGHELHVLRGARGLLRRHAVRDLVFEEHLSYPTRVTDYLERLGYAVYLLDHGLRGPWIGAPDTERRVMGDQSFLATIEPERALARLARRGWAIFGRIGVLDVSVQSRDARRKQAAAPRPWSRGLA